MTNPPAARERESDMLRDVTHRVTRTLVLCVALCALALLVAGALLTRQAQAPPQGIGARSEPDTATAVSGAAMPAPSSSRSTSDDPRAPIYDIAAQQPISLRGRVIASESGLPLSGAMVQPCLLDMLRRATTDLGNAVTTGDDGRFACAIDTTALVYLRVSRHGYASRVVGPLDDRRETSVELDADCNVAFHIVRAGSGEPLAGVACQVRWRDRNVLVTSAWLTTDASGVLHVGCMRASHGAIRVLMAPHAFHDVGIDIGREPQQMIEIVVPARRDRTLTVVDEGGNPIPGASVEIAHNRDYATTTDASGRAVLATWDEGLPLVVRARGYSLTAYSLAAEGHGASPARIELASAGTLIGSCASDEECVVSVRSTDPAFGSVVWGGLSRATAGAWRIDDVQVGHELVLAATYASGKRVQLVLPPLASGESRSVEVPAEVPTCRIAGTVSGATGPTVVRWYAHAKGTTRAFVWMGEGHTATGPDGAFEVALVGCTDLEIWAETGVRRTPKRWVQVTEPAQEVMLTFGPAIEGMLTDQHGLPLARAVVWLTSRDPGCRPLAARTDGKGKFVLDGLVPGARYEVGCSGPDLDGIVDGPREVTSGVGFVGLVVRRKG
jgi:hypothetical protein